jgi:hypothetical protein
LSLGGKAIGVVADVCVRADLERLVQEVCGPLSCQCYHADQVHRLQRNSVQSTSSSATPEPTPSCHST